jgi:two-component system, NtrC family, sensor kinase
MGDYDSAYNLLKQLKTFKNTSLGQTSDIDYKTAIYYQRFNKIDSSIFYAQKALEKAIQGNFYSKVNPAAQLLSDLYKDSNPAKSLEFDAIIVANQDGLFRTSGLSAMKNLLNFDEHERRYVIETAQIAYKNKTKQYAFISGLAILLLLAYFFYRNYEKEKSAKKEIHLQKEKVEQTLSQLKSTQAQLIQSEKMASLGELTAGIAHEIQNPLNFVNNFSEVSKELAEELKEEANKENFDKGLIAEIATDIAENQKKIHHHGQRASSIVKGMLEHSRTSTGTKELTDINALADEYLRLSYHGLRAKNKDFNAELVTNFEPNLPKIEVIPQDMGRVLLNLINNAFQAVDEASSTLRDSSAASSASENYRPTVTVSTKNLAPLSTGEGRGGEVELRVTDNGPGIPHAIKDKIFQPFFTTKDTGKGTGLGLSLAYDIVKAHGGEIKVASEVGKGSEFIILLPIPTK